MTNDIPKIIHMTYRYLPPEYVFNRWKELNKDYTIDFSLEHDCISFLRDNFDSTITNTYNDIKEGIYKADLWILCKLYIVGGVYTDIDLVPYISIDEIINTNNSTLYSCLNEGNNGILQKFIITKPKNPLILSFIFSYLKNNEYNYSRDMYNCIKWNLKSYVDTASEIASEIDFNLKSDTNIISGINYNLDIVKLDINIGSSNSNLKIINLYYFPIDTEYEIILEKNHYDDTFDFIIIDSKLNITRTDKNSGWGHNHSVLISLKYKQYIYFFKEKSNTILTYDNIKILDCIDFNECIPKIIYMTYKYLPPEYVFNRWKELNKDYTIDFSLDCDCISFLIDNFDSTLSDMFINIKEGMYKADLWRLCKLYINGGVYADIDLVPYISIDEIIYKNNNKYNSTFYSCMNQGNNGIFQAFIITKPKNPLILSFIFSFLKNKPYAYMNGPTHDMYNCIKFNLNNTNITSGINYSLNTVKYDINIGSSDTNTKIINLYYFPNDTEYDITSEKNKYNDTFIFKIEDNKLSVKRTDMDSGWGCNISVVITIKSKQYIYLFKENGGYMNAFVTYNNIKIFACRDSNYVISKNRNKKWI